jgi:hypothetical protein
MEDNHNLEKFFRQKFNQKIEPQDWNIPDNDIWDSIATQIPSEKKRRGLGMLPLFILVGALLSATLILGHENYLKSNEIVELQQELKECADQVVVNEKRSENQIQQLSNEATNKSAPIKTPNNQQTKMQSNFQKHSMKEDRLKSLITDIQNQHTGSVSETSGMDNNNNVSKEINIIDTPAVHKHFNTTIAYPPSLNENPFNPLISNHVKKIPAPEFNLTSILPRPKPMNQYFLGTNIGYIFWQDRIKGNFDNPLSELLVKEETMPSIQYGFIFGKVLNKHFIFNTGINYYERNQKSRYAINLPYSTVDEIAVGTEFENKFQHSLPTGLGVINTNLVLSRSVSSVVQNNENVYLDFEISNHIKAISIPLMFSYFIKNAGDGLFVQSGLSHEWIIKNEIKEINTESHHPLVKDKSIVVNYNTSQTNKLNTSLLLGIGYQKSLRKNIDISLSSQYGFALSNTYQSNEYQHKIDQLNVQIRLSKSW